MSDFRIDQITNQAGTAGPQIAGITTFSSTSGLIMPRGDTEGRYINYDITNGLILKLDAGNLNSYSPNKNRNIWYDLSSNKFDASLKTVTYTPNNVPVYEGTFSPDYKGSIVFDGVNDSASLSMSRFDVATKFSTKAITVISFGKISSTSTSINGGKNALLSFNGTFNFFYPGTRLGPTQQLFWDNVSSWKGSTNTTWTLNQWYQFAWTIDSSRNLLMYNNGILDSSHALSQDFYPENQLGFGEVKIGLGNGNEFLHGNIATLQVYNRALTALEIRQNYEAYRSRFGL